MLCARAFGVLLSAGVVGQQAYVGSGFSRTWQQAHVASGFSRTWQTPPAITELRTHAEASNYEETSRHADVEQFIAGLERSPLVHRTSFGRTEEGRSLPLLVIADRKVESPEEARSTRRPIVLLQANIHGGEVEGKEASLALARRLVSGDLQPLTRRLVVLIAPIYNADGNERISLTNRSSQNGPTRGVGTRENAKGLDLNRDYMKLDSAEARALVSLLHQWDPHVVVDLHTTNGSYHGYHLTYSPILNPNADSRLIRFERDTLLPAIRTAVQQKHGFRTYYYGNFSPENGGGKDTSRVDPAKPGDITWRTFDHRPRFGNNYVGLRNRVAILAEAYSYLDFKGRIKVTEAFTEELLHATVANERAVQQLTAAADSDLAAKESPAKPVTLGVEFDIRALDSPVEILVGDVARTLNPRSGREMLQMTPAAIPVRMKDYGIFAAVRSAPLPQGWLIPRDEVESGRLTGALSRLQTHGIRVQTVSSSSRLTVEQFVTERLVRSERPFQNRFEARISGRREPAQIRVEPGSLFIPARQPLARLAFYLIEPESDDGLAAWGIIDEGLKPGTNYPIHAVLDASPLRLN